MSRSFLTKKTLFCGPTASKNANKNKLVTTMMPV